MDMKAAPPRVWILLGNRQGDNNQLIALAEALGWPYEAKRLTYNQLRRFAFLRSPRLWYLTQEARNSLTPPWPELVIGLGYDSMPVSRSIRSQSGGRTRLIQIGNPRTSLDDIDLVITTPQYSLKQAPNVLALPFPVGNPARAVSATDTEEEWLRPFPSPRRLIAVGGSTRQWKIDIAELDAAIGHLQAECARHGGSVIAATSRRTPGTVTSLLKARLKGQTEACVEDFPRFGVLLARCDEFYVTADSVSMLAEAILTGKPVGMIPIRRSLRGQADYWLRKCGWNLPSNADLSRFWRYLASNNLVGGVDSPVASDVRDTVQTAADAVRAVMDRVPRDHPIGTSAVTGSSYGSLKRTQPAPYRGWL